MVLGLESHKMYDAEAFSWCSYVLVVKNFLSNHKPDIYAKLVQKVFDNFKNLGVIMTIKVYFFIHVWTGLHRILLILVMNYRSFVNGIPTSSDGNRPVCSHLGWSTIIPTYLAQETPFWRSGH